MREILFRGEENPSGEWIEGFLVGNCHIGDWVTCTPIHSKTVGQFTGLTDKNGTKIFEGDIVRIQNDTPFEMTGHIIFQSGCFELHDPTCDMYECLWYEAKDMEVLGNIHDNPELLEEE